MANSQHTEHRYKVNDGGNICSGAGQQAEGMEVMGFRFGPRQPDA